MSRLFHIGVKLVVAVHDGHTPSTQHVARPNDEGIPDASGHLAGFLVRRGHRRRWVGYSQPVEQSSKAVAVLGEVDGFGWAAAIGSGSDASGGKVVINYGTVTAMADGQGAGIGAGAYTGASRSRSDYDNGGTVIINGGTVTASGDPIATYGGGAGIGGGQYCNGATVTITGGTVTATGAPGGGAGIGGGLWGDGGTCTITGGHVTASKSSRDTGLSPEPAGIGNGGGKYLSGTGKVILDYTDMNMSVTSSSYSASYYTGGTLTLRKSFMEQGNPDNRYAAAENMDFHEETMRIIDSMEGITLVPGSFTVTFDPNDGSGEVTTQTVAYGETAGLPMDPSKEGFIFIGWRLVTDGQMSPRDFNFSTPITEDTLLKAFYIDPKERQGETFSIEIRDGAPDLEVLNADAVVSATLTDEEIGAGHYLLLVSSPLSEVPEADKTVLEAKTKSLGATAGTWFDISLYKVLGDEMTQLSKAGTALQLKTEVPQSLRASGRTFNVLRSHDSQAKLAIQGTSNTLQWKTDEFSTYEIAYKDKASSSSSKAASSSSSRSTLAKTGDSNSFGTIAIVFAAGAIALVTGMAQRRKRLGSWSRSQGEQ